MRRSVAALLLATFLAAPALAQDALEQQIWNAVKDSGQVESLQTYLRAYPAGAFAAEAQTRIDALQASRGAAAAGGLVAPEEPEAATAAPAQAADGPQLNLAKTEYAPFEPVAFSWSKMPASVGCIMLLAPGGQTQVDAHIPYFGEHPAGKATVRGAVPGRYELVVAPSRCDPTEAFLRQAIEVREPGPGTAPDYLPTLATAKPSFAPLEPIGVTWSNIRAPSGKVVLRDMKQDREITSEWVDFESAKKVAGEASFPGQLPGEYEVQVVVGNYDSPYVLARAPLTIGEAAQASGDYAPAVATGKPVYAPLEPITVTYKDIKASGGWIILQEAGAPIGPGWSQQALDRESPSFASQGGSGSVTFDGRLPGEYEVVILVGNYDSPYALARTAVSVQAPGQASTTTTAAPAQQTAATPAPAGMSTRLGRIAFADAPTKADVGRFAQLVKVASEGVKQPCRGGEAYSWKLQSGEGSRPTGIIAAANQTLVGSRYAVSRLNLDLPNALAYKAVNAGAGGADKALLLIWYLQESDFYLVVCETDA